MPKYDRELIARMLLGPRVFSPESVAEQARLLREAENLESDAKTVVREVPDGMEELRDLAPRALELAERLVMSGPKAAHVSASETHEIADFVRDTVAMLSAASGEKGVG
ncbi:MAG TPA: hypothetical protein VGE19_07395 [Pseudoxanthomonas sp.]